MVHSQRNSRGGSPLTLGTTLVVRRLLLSIFLKMYVVENRLIKEKKNLSLRRCSSLENII